MAEFTMEIAGHTGRVTSLFDSTPHQFSRYLTDRAPEFSVTVREADLPFEQAELDREALEEGFRRRVFTDPFLERAAIQRKFAEYLILHDTLLVHGSTVAVDGKAYLFAARSGTGKSTHTRLWMRVFGSRALMVNDDKPFLEITDAAVLAHGSPWSGKHGLDTNVTVPLQGICILRRGSENRIAPLPAEAALPMLLHQSVLPGDRRPADRLDALTEELARHVRLWQMDCTKDPEAARMAWQAMSETE